MLEHENQDSYVSHFDEVSVQFNKVSTAAADVRQHGLVNGSSGRQATTLGVFGQIARLLEKKYN